MAPDPERSGFPRRPPRELFRELGIDDLDSALLSQALVHPSFANERAARGESWSDKSRLEFLGDAVLDLVVSQHLYLEYPYLPEGQLTKLRAGIVSRSALYDAARRVDLGQFLFLSHGDELAGARERVSILAETLEALMAAVYLSGGLSRVEAMVMDHLEIGPRIKGLLSGDLGDPKSLLQEMTQARGLGTPTYRILERRGPDHSPVFRAEVMVGDRAWAQGSGVSKREAEAAAALNALERSGWLSDGALRRDFPEGRE